METSARAALNASPPAFVPSAATLAKGALRRLVMAQLEPTPENYAKAYSEESGQPARSTLPMQVLVLVERLLAESLDTIGPAAHAKFMLTLSKGKWEEGSHLLDDYIPRCREGRANAEALLIEQVADGLGRDNDHWTPERKKDSLLRVLAGSRNDVLHLQQRVRQLVSGWDDQPLERQGEAGAAQAAPSTRPDESTALAPPSDLPGAANPNTAEAPMETAAAPLDIQIQNQSYAVADASPASLARPAAGELTAVWLRLLNSLGAATQQGLPSDDARCAALASDIAALTASVEAEGPTERAAEQLEGLCRRAQTILLHRHQMVDQLGKLCHELTAGLADLSEDASWARGQCDAMRVKLEEGLTPRGVRAVSGLLKATREKQIQLRLERESARTALRGLVNNMLHELDDLGAHTGRFHENVGRYADVIEQADSLESLATVVRDMAAESRQAKTLMTATQERLNTEHDNAGQLNERVSLLETELRRLSEEVSTDQLTQIANRRGLHQAFAAEKARAERTGKPLSIGLIDVDDFKKLNDTLGHNAGDDALKALAAKVRDGLRPTDTVARYGGEEFVVMLPDTDPETAVVVLTRLQRSLTRGLFMHNQQQVFVTFSAGVSLYRIGEPLEDALDRADESLYEAKRTGKNRTCIS